MDIKDIKDNCSCCFSLIFIFSTIGVFAGTFAGAFAFMIKSIQHHRIELSLYALAAQVIIALLGYFSIRRINKWANTEPKSDTESEPTETENTVPDYKKREELSDLNTCILMLFGIIINSKFSLTHYYTKVVESYIQKHSKNKYEQSASIVKMDKILKSKQKYSTQEICDSINQHLYYMERRKLVMDLLEVAYADSVYQNEKVHDIIRHLDFNSIESIDIYFQFKFKDKKEKTVNHTVEEYYKYSILILLAAMMNADSKQMSCELDRVKSSICRYYKTEEEQKKALKTFQEILNDKYDIKLICDFLNGFLNNEGKSELIMELLAIAYADDEFRASEINMIENIYKYFHLSEFEYARIYAIFMNKYKQGNYHSREDRNKGKSTSLQSKEAYKILGIDENMSDEEVKKAYHAMAVKYHPDNAAKLGEEAIRQATETMKLINAAWDTVKMARGMK